MVRVVNCHAEVLGLNPGGPKRFFPWNYFSVMDGWIDEGIPIIPSPLRGGGL